MAAKTEEAHCFNEEFKVKTREQKSGGAVASRREGFVSTVWVGSLGDICRSEEQQQKQRRGGGFALEVRMRVSLFVLVTRGKACDCVNG